MDNFSRKVAYAGSPIPYDRNVRSRIGGGIPIYFEDKLDLIENYLFYATIEHPQLRDSVFSIFIPASFERMLKENVYPNCSIKIFLHGYSEESLISSCVDENLSRGSISDLEEVGETDSDGYLVRLGGLPDLIQKEEYFYSKLISDGYSFFMQIDEDYYSENLLKGNYPFGYGRLYLYCKYHDDHISDIIAGFWQYS
jgi:hypothetical protein